LLPPDLSEFDHARPRRDPTKGGPRFDRLQLLGITHENDFGAGPLGALYHSRELASSNQAGFIDDQHITLAQQVAPVRPASFPARQRTSGNSAGILQVFS